jgi:hypothetical protein
MVSDKIPLSIDPKILESALLRNPNNRSGAIATSLQRYFDLLNHPRKELKKMFSPNECGLILDALNGAWLANDFSVRMIPASIVDAIELDALDRKWEVDSDEMKAKVNELPVLMRYVIADAVLVWWEGKLHQVKEYGNLFDF